MGSALIISLRKRRIRCPTRSKHRLYVPFVRQKRGGLPKVPLHVRRGALRRAVPAALSGPRGLRCRGKCPGEGSYTTAPLSFGQCPLPCPAQEACIAGDSAPGRGHTHQRPFVIGQCPLPCPAQEVCIAGDSAPGRGHTQQRPFVIRQCPLPCPAQEVCIAGDSAPGRGHTQQRPLALGSARCLFRPIFLCCSLYHAPGLFPCLFILPLAGPASHPAYAPAATSPARYRAGRSKQHHHARNVKPLPPSGESEGHTPRAGGGEGGHLPVPLAFFASFWQKKEESPSLYAP